MLIIGLMALVSAGNAQVCEDRDADGAAFGWECTAATDCEDLSWHRRPGALEVCDGLDNDCDGSLDQTCDRWCDEVALYPVSRDLVVDGLPEAIPESCFALMDDGFITITPRIVAHSPSPYSTLLYGRAHDHLGAPWAPATAVAEPEIVDPFERRCAIAAAGDRALIVWQDAHLRGAQSNYRLKARIVDGRGAVLSPVVDLSSTAPVGEAPWIHHDAVWDGERFIVFWTPWGYRKNLLMSVVHSDGSLAEPATTIVTDDVDGNSSTIQDIGAAWTGDQFIVVVSDDKGNLEHNLDVLRVSREGTLLGRDHIPDHADHHFDIALGGDRIAVAWTQGTALWLEGRVAFITLDGDYLASPGVGSLFSEGMGFSATDSFVAWSGEMFAIATTYYKIESSQYVYRWRFWRVLPSGSVLDPGGVLLAYGSSLGDIDDLAWNGKEFWMTALRDPNRLVLERVVCSCQDEDGDTYDACTEYDCDDDDPLSHPLALEDCRGLRDEDCDGLVDCEDPDCPGGAGPADVTSLAWTGNRLVWNPVAGAERYDVARGRLSDTRRRDDLLQAECVGLEMATTEWEDDGRAPPPGEVLWYLVRPEGAPCELGSWGQGVTEREVTACR
jgi:hypothetical protein